MDAPTALVTGSSGLVGSEVSADLCARGWTVHGVDSHQRAVFFGPSADTRWNEQRLRRSLRTFHQHAVDVRDRDRLLALAASIRPALIVHPAPHPPHARPAPTPFDDFETNALGTLILLGGARRFCKESPFV